MAQNKEAKLEFSKIKSITKIVFINLIILFFLLYILELFLQMGSDNLFKKTKFYYQNKLEKEAKEEGLNYEAATFPWAASGRAW